MPKNMSMATTTAFRAASAASLQQKIRQLVDNIDYSRSKLNRQTLELYATTYLYAETRVARDQWTHTDVFRELSESIGKHHATWNNYYRRGEFIRNNKLDLDKVRPSSLSQLPNGELERADLPRIITALNRGDGPSKIRQILIEQGYSELPKIPYWSKKMIRASKKGYRDWHPELHDLAERIALMTDKKNINLQLQVVVDGRVVASVKRGELKSMERKNRRAAAAG